MIFSPPFHTPLAPSECVVSRDGHFIATLLAARVIFRSVQTLQVQQEVDLPRSFTGPASTLIWSPSSRKLLVGAGDQLHIISVAEAGGPAAITSPASSSSKPSFVGFGLDDDTIFVCSGFGLKFAMYNLATGNAVEVNNPKFFQSPSAVRGFSFRPASSHVALLTRTSGRDCISIHSPTTHHLHRSWFPDIVDAQGVAWSSDGRWILVWESAAYGYKLLFYTPDGNLFRSWAGPPDSTQALPHMLPHVDLGSGIKQCIVSPDRTRAAVSDQTSTIYVMDIASPAVNDMRLQHPSGPIKPTDTLQIWQAHWPPFQDQGRHHGHFARLNQPCSPPVQSSSSASSQSPSVDAAFSGTNAVFDASSALLATRLDENPTTIWIWDTSVAELRAVLIFHSSVTSVQWHPTVHELIMVTCQDDKETTVFTWDPLSAGPQMVDYVSHLPRTEKHQGGQSAKVRAEWVNSGATLLIVGDSYSLLACSLDSDNTDRPELHWQIEAVGDQSPSPDPDGLGIDDTFAFRKKLA